MIIPVSSVSGSGGSASSAYSSEKKDKDSDSTIEEDLKVIICIILSEFLVFCFQNGKDNEGDDTMKNLRTSFAGLFGSDLK